MRPKRRVLADGSTIRWTHGEGKELTATWTDAAGIDHRWNRSADGRSVTAQAGGLSVISAVYDEQERLTSLSEGDKTLLQQK